VYTAAELLAAVETRYRRRFPLHVDRAFGEFPPTWRLWFLAIRERPGAVTGAPAVDWTTAFAQRPLRAPPRAPPPLGRMAALRALMRARWEPAPREERGLRALAATLSTLTHVVLAFLFFWVALVRMEPSPRAADEAGDVTLVEFIGEGTPDTPGDAAPQTAVEEARRGEQAASGADAARDARTVADAAESATGSDSATPADSAAPTAAAEIARSAESTDPAPPAAPAEVADAAAEAQQAPAEQPVAEVPPAVERPPVEQPLIVGEKPVPTPGAFTLPPTTLRLPERPLAALPSAEASPSAAREIPLVERRAAASSLALPQQRQAAPLAAPASSPSREIPLVRRSVGAAALPLPQGPAVRLPEARLPEATASGGREVVLAPRPAAESAALPLPGTAQRRLPDADAGRGAPARQIPLRAPSATAAGAASGTEGRPTATAGRPDVDGASASGAAAPAPTPAGRPGGTARSGAGPRPGNPPGGLPAPVRGDDWGMSERDRPGSGAGRQGATGLFNSDGSARLPGDGGRVGGGLPPGTITEDFAKIDRMGTWLKRPPVDYTPSRFDKLFVPDESLLQEWVRRNVREVFVPIPGASKRLRCVVSILQAAGGCTIDDPNLRDQEAEARPPPAVPYKPELQERE